MTSIFIPLPVDFLGIEYVRLLSTLAIPTSALPQLFFGFQQKLVESLGEYRDHLQIVIRINTLNPRQHHVQT